MLRNVIRPFKSITKDILSRSSIVAGVSFRVCFDQASDTAMARVVAANAQRTAGELVAPVELDGLSIKYLKDNVKIHANDPAKNLLLRLQIIVRSKITQSEPESPPEIFEGIVVLKGKCFKSNQKNNISFRRNAGENQEEQQEEEEGKERKKKNEDDSGDDDYYGDDDGDGPGGDGFPEVAADGSAINVSPNKSPGEKPAAATTAAATGIGGAAAKKRPNKANSKKATPAEAAEAAEAAKAEPKSA